MYFKAERGLAEKRSKIHCRYWTAKGLCHTGKKCPYMHADEMRGMVTQSAVDNDVGNEVRKMLIERGR